MTKLGERLLQSIDEARAIARGEAKPARAIDVSGPDVAAIRKRPKLSEEKYAECFHLPAASVRIGSRGEGRRTPPRNIC
jgi:putative transcriptional regulator